MATTRLFMGDMGGGDFRARISKPGYDAAAPTLPHDKLLFDSSWAFIGKPHVIGKTTLTASQTSKTIVFPALPYIPAVYGSIYYTSNVPLVEGYPQPANSIRIRTTLGHTYDELTFLATQDSVTITRPAASGFALKVYYAVFRIPMKEIDLSGSQTGNVPRMLIGKRNANYGLYVSQPGFNVETCPESRLVFNSDNVSDINLFRTYRFDATSVHFADSTWGHITSGGFPPSGIPIPNQGFIPFAIWFLQGRRTGTSQQMLVPQWLEAAQWPPGSPGGDPFIDLTWSANRVYMYGNHLNYPRVFRGIGLIFDKPF